MNQCKNKQKHKWVRKYGLLAECSGCGRIKTFKSVKPGKKYAKGTFGSKRKALPEYNGKVIRKSERTKENCNKCGVTI